MFKSLDIQKDMEVVGLDGKHVGTVDHLEAADRIILSKDDPKAGGRQHLISIDWVDYGTRRSISISRRQKQHRNGRRQPKPWLSPQNNEFVIFARASQIRKLLLEIALAWKRVVEEVEPES
jgi:hypothetical protein